MSLEKKEPIFPKNWKRDKRLTGWKKEEIQKNICPSCHRYGGRFARDGGCQFCGYPLKGGIVTNLTNEETFDSNQTKESIALAKELKELGVRKEIRYGGWFIDMNSTGNTPILHSTFEDENKDKNLPLWQIHDCLEWLRGKGYKVTIDSVAESWFVAIWKLGHQLEVIKHWEASLLEALLKAMIQVAKEGGKQERRNK